MTAELTIRPARPSDLDTVVAFNAAMALETENLELDAATLRRGAAKALDHPDWCDYFIAERDGVVVGQCMVTFEWSDWRDGWLWWFQSVYVHPDHRRGGVFRGLYRFVETRATARDDVRGLRLYVERGNESAMETYRALGMVPSGHVVYERDWS